MDHNDETLLRGIHTRLIGILDAKYVVDRCYELRFLSKDEVRDIRKLETPSERSAEFLFIITNRCKFNEFLELLEQCGYDFLASEILDHKSAQEENLPPSMRKISVYNTKWRPKTSFIAHELTRLVHNGETGKFYKYRNKLVKRWRRNFANDRIKIEDRLQYADQAFVALDTEVSLKRIKYDPNLINDPTFKLMQKVMLYTSNPIITTMAYLARLSSAMAIGKPLEDGLVHLQYAKAHADSVSPCRESGMGFYIEFNMLSQKYEKDGPTEILKSNLIKTAKTAIGHFNEEDKESIRKDFRRMLLLKIAYVHLGIGTFGNTINAATVSENDVRSAKSILDEIEEPELWRRMEMRRKMFYHIAKSRFYHIRKQYDLASAQAKTAKALSEEGNFTRELPHIEELITNTCSEPEGIEVVNQELVELMDDISDNDGSDNEES